MIMTSIWIAIVFSLVTGGVQCGSKVYLVKTQTFKPLLNTKVLFEMKYSSL